MNKGKRIKRPVHYLNSDKFFLYASVVLYRQDSKKSKVYFARETRAEMLSFLSNRFYQCNVVGSTRK